jgi:hypothetical protein
MIREADIALPALRWIEAQGWDCYPEAQLKHAGGRADIAAVRGQILWIIEAKIAFSLSLLEQAYAWVNLAHYVSVVISRRRLRNTMFAEHLCRSVGIGVIYVDSDSAVYETLPPRLHRSAALSARRAISELHQDMKKYTPGGRSSDGFSTPWKRTMDAVQEYIVENPGCTIREIIDVVPTHYSNSRTARSSIPVWLRDERFPIRVENDGKLLRFYPGNEHEPDTTNP